MNLLFTLLTLQALLGGADNLWHHEITERLPSKRGAAGELTLHAVRGLLYGFLFLGLAFREWHGLWAVVIGVVLALEVIITLADFLIEDKTRRLPPSERILHSVLALNFGAILLCAAKLLLDWNRLPTQLIPADHGFMSMLFSVFALGVIAWAVRDALAVLTLTRPPEWVRDPLLTGTPSGRTLLISGATGFIGSHLVRRFVRRGDKVIVLSRDPDRALDRFGPQVTIISRLSEIDNEDRIDAIVNLAGAPILSLPWTRSRRNELLSSRIETTRELVRLGERLARPPRVFVSASAIGYYGVHADEPLDEHCGPGEGFQSLLCREWEAAALGAESPVTRLVRIRFGLVLGRDGGVLPRLALPHHLALGATLGSGSQWMSWIHIEDLVRLVEFCIDKPNARGVFNGVAPLPVRHQEFQQSIAKQLRRSLWLKIPAAPLRALLGEMSTLLLDGQRVLPNRSVAMGFDFRHHNLAKALRDLLLVPEAVRAGAEIYYNGDCPVCSLEMRHYGRICASLEPSLSFVDSVRHGQDFVQWGLRKEHLQRRLYLRDSRGRTLSGLSAMLALWSRMPTYRPLAAFLRLPGIRGLAELTYDHLVSPLLAHWGAVRAARAQDCRRELV